LKKVIVYYLLGCLSLYGFFQLPDIYSDLIVYLVWGVLVAVITSLIGGFGALIYGRIGLYIVSIFFSYPAIQKGYLWIKSFHQPIYQTKAIRRLRDGSECWDGWITFSRGSGSCSHHGGVKGGFMEFEKTIEIPTGLLFDDFWPFGISATTLLILVVLDQTHKWTKQVKITVIR